MSRFALALLTSALACSLSACIGGGRADPTPDRSAEQAAVSQQMSDRVNAIPGVTKSNVAFTYGKSGVDSPHAGGLIICAGADETTLKRVLDEALPEIAKLTPGSDPHTYVSLTVSKDAGLSDGGVDPRAVGFTDTMPKLADVKRHYGI